MEGKRRRERKGCNVSSQVHQEDERRFETGVFLAFLLDRSKEIGLSSDLG
jgi:RNA:NAD 2'-phosphotransferase (TPT1/KptA family)